MPLFILTGLAKIQKHLKDALRRRCANFLSNDWLSDDKAKSFPLKEYYTELEWQETSKRALVDTNKTMARMKEVLKIGIQGGAVNVAAKGKDFFILDFYRPQTKFRGGRGFPSSHRNPWRETLQTETPKQRSLDRYPHTPDRDPLDREPSQTGTHFKETPPRQRPPILMSSSGHRSRR